MADERSSRTLGPNEWLVDEMYEQYKANPSSVTPSWQEFFADYGNDKSEVITGREPRGTTASARTPRRRGHPRRERPHRGQHGGQPHRPHGHELP